MLLQYPTNNKMQVISMRLKLLLKWMITKKQSLLTLKQSNLSINRAAKEFTVGYIGHLQELILKIQKFEKQQDLKYQSKRQRNIRELFVLIKAKEQKCIDEWKKNLEILQNQKQQTKLSNNSIEILKNIETNIQYYEQLNNKISQFLQKAQQKLKTQIMTERQPLNLFSSSARKTNSLRGSQYYSEYSQKLSKMIADHKQKQKQHRTDRTIGAIRMNTPKSIQLSPYKSVNPRYSPIKQKTTKSPSSTNPKSSKKIERVSEQRPRYTAERYLLDDSPVKNYSKFTDIHNYSTAETQKNNSSRQKAKVVSKKYQYLFDDDREFTDIKVKKQLFTNEVNKNNISANHDSLELVDQLGHQLEVEMPGIFHEFEKKQKKNDNLQRMLTDSIMSSKKWDSNSENSDNDSLDEMQKKIFQTGKFQSLGPLQNKIERFEQIESNKQQNYTPYRSQSPKFRPLNVSFGRQ